GRHLIWGNQLVGGDALAAVALGTDTTWGATVVPGANVVSSTVSDTDVDNIVWGTSVLDAGDDVIWSSDGSDSRLPTTNSHAGDLEVAELGVGSYQGAERRS